MAFLLCLLALQDAPETLIEALRSDRPEERERATRALKQLGGAAVDAVEPLIEDADAEVAWRAREIVAPHFGPRSRKMLQAVEQRLLGAKSVRIRFRSVPEAGKSRLSGELCTREGNKATGWIMETGTENPYSARFWCNGTRARVDRADRQLTLNWRDADTPMERDAPPGFSQDLLKCFLRAGALSAINAEINRLLRSTPGDLSDVLSAESPKFLFLGDRSSVVRYGIWVGGELLHHQVTLKPGEGTVAGRRIFQGERPMSTEIYEEVLLGEDLPDEKFELPGK